MCHEAPGKVERVGLGIGSAADPSSEGHGPRSALRAHGSRRPAQHSSSSRACSAVSHEGLWPDPSAETPGLVQGHADLEGLEPRAASL